MFRDFTLTLVFLSVFSSGAYADEAWPPKKSDDVAPPANLIEVPENNVTSTPGTESKPREVKCDEYYDEKGSLRVSCPDL